MSDQQNIQILFNFLDLEKCFKSFYVVPDYQREYVWEERQVNQLLNDVFAEFDDNVNKEYFIGSTVVFKNNGYYELIDGQQRTTTLFIIICAFKKLYTDWGLSTDTLDRMIKDKSVDDLGDSVDRYTLELQYDESTTILADIASMSKRPHGLKGSAERLYNAFDTILAFLHQHFDEDNPQELKKFFVYLYRKLKFIQIETPEIDDALKIFETINERGIGLNPMDLLKNLIFRQVPRDKFSKLNDKWKTLVDTLEKNGEKPLRFLRYFLMANYDIRSPKGEDILREDEIYKSLMMSENETLINYRKKPFVFVDRMIDNARDFVTFFNGRDQLGVNVHLSNIKKLGGGAFRQHLILLLAARHLEHNLFTHFAQQVESLVFYYFITKEPAKNLERYFSKWAKQLQNIKTGDDLNAFLNNEFSPALVSRKSEFKSSFLELRLGSMQKYRVRYILAKIAQYVDLQRQGASSSQLIDSYISKGIEIEHILPETPEQELRDLYGEEYDDIKTKLGNLTLLEKSINASIGNKDFLTVKRDEYAKSSIYLTRSIASKKDVGVNTAVTRINKDLKSFDTWNSQSIEDRHDMLFSLAKDIWTISEY